MKKSLIVAGTVYTILCLCSIGAHINIISGVLSAALNLFVFGTLFYVVHELLGEIEKLEKKLEKDLYVKKTSIERKTSDFSDVFIFY